VFPIRKSHWIKGRTRGEDTLSLGMSVGLSGRALGLVGGIGESEDQRSFVEMTHLLDDLFGEGAALSTHSNDCCGFDHIHCFGERGRNYEEEKEEKEKKNER
jgi:hypothetical protein